MKLGLRGALAGRIGAKVALGLAAGATLALAPGAQAATGPFEPNDSVLAAAGPLAFGSSYEATLETVGDADFYFFYVTSRKPAPVALAVANRGGAAGSPVIDATITDASSTPLAALSYLGQGTTGTVTLSLPPQKYFVEVATNQAFNTNAGISYTLTPGGGKGAFGPYAQIAGRCAHASKALAKARKGLRRAWGKLQRTRARLRLSRFGSRKARRAARRAQRRVRRRIRVKHRAAARAKSAQRPWCSIPQ